MSADHDIQWNWKPMTGPDGVAAPDTFEIRTDGLHYRIFLSSAGIGSPCL